MLGKCFAHLMAFVGEAEDLHTQLPVLVEGELPPGEHHVDLDGRVRFNVEWSPESAKRNR